MPETVSFGKDSDTRAAREVAGLWWVLVVLGALSLIAGVIFIVRPSHSLATLAVVFGIFVVIDGIAELFSSLTREGNRALAAILGVLGVVVGIILIRHPTHAVNAIGLVIGLWLVAAGVVRLVRAFAEGVSLLLRGAVAVLEIVVGIVVVSEPHIGYTTLAVLIGIWLILNALGLAAAGLLLRAAKSEL